MSESEDDIEFREVPFQVHVTVAGHPFPQLGELLEPCLQNIFAAAFSGIAATTWSGALGFGTVDENGLPESLGKPRHYRMFCTCDPEIGEAIITTVNRLIGQGPRPL